MSLFPWGHACGRREPTARASWPRTEGALAAQLLRQPATLHAVAKIWHHDVGTMQQGVATISASLLGSRRVDSEAPRAGFQC